MYDELVKQLRNDADYMDNNGIMLYAAAPFYRECAAAIEEVTAVAESYKRSMEAWADEAARAQPRWIPVTERMPKPYTEVMVAFDDGKVYALWQDWEAQDERDEPLCYMINPFGTEAWHAVTHWMPLPPAPEPSKEEA